MIAVQLNGEARELGAALSLSQALEQWGYRCDKVAVAINTEFVPRSRYHEIVIKNGDALDVVAPVQGG
ncbi:MAG TPA: sulfur carrier protein ThiS [Spongiibacteraceae bacterium]|nr:sulfur carrier protein ThiS [Spongiibacteraceae bacterium]HUH36683.1 sulfur carrier protein ThiS [Spongiibacteraceae bacterium]